MTTLAAKLGITEDSLALVVGPVPEAVLDQLFNPDQQPDADRYDVIVAFNDGRAMLDHNVTTLPAQLTVAGGLWLCWLKKASGVPTDIGEADVRAAGIDAGLVDNKIAAIDESWSGLRFVRRLADR